MPGADLKKEAPREPYHRMCAAYPLFKVGSLFNCFRRTIRRIDSATHHNQRETPRYYLG
jgi:hypothetical protein